MGAPAKPSEAGSLGRGGVAERLSFWPKGQNEGCGACDDVACRPLVKIRARHQCEFVWYRYVKSCPD